MNLNFISKEFERLSRIEDYINYEYEPKSNKRFGKRNIYFDDIKLDFINEVNTYGFSPFILKNFGEQRDDPNIMRFMTKKFNHGLTNYVKLGTRTITHHTPHEIKKYISRKKNINIKKKKKKKEIYSNIYLIKKNEDKKKDEIQDNFLHKALLGMGGHKLNISMDDDEEKEKDERNEKKDKKDKKDKKEKKEDDKSKTIANSVIESLQKKDISKNQKDLILKEKEILEKKQDEKNIQLLKEYIGIDKGKYTIGASELQQLPNLFGNNDSNPKTTLKLIFQNKGFNIKNLKMNLNNDNNKGINKRILSLSKNKELLTNKREYIFKNIFSKHNDIENQKFNTINVNKDIDINKKYMKTENKFNFKRLITKKRIKDEFLLFAKARPYRYLTMNTIEI